MSNCPKLFRPFWSNDLELKSFATTLIIFRGQKIISFFSNNLIFIVSAVKEAYFRKKKLSLLVKIYWMYLNSKLRRKINKEKLVFDS